MADTRPDTHKVTIPMDYQRKCSRCSSYLSNETQQDGKPSYCATCDREMPADHFDHTPNVIVVSVDYDKGGPNYFHGGTNPRGYALGLFPQCKRDGMVRFALTGARGNEAGKRFLLLPAARYNAKKHAELAARILPHAETLARWHFIGNIEAVRAFVGALTTKAA